VADVELLEQFVAALAALAALRSRRVSRIARRLSPTLMRRKIEASWGR
jgi:hypothetical protein